MLEYGYLFWEFRVSGLIDRKKNIGSVLYFVMFDIKCKWK